MAYVLPCLALELRFHDCKEAVNLSCFSLAYPVMFRSCSPPSLQGSKLGASLPVRDIARMGQVQGLTMSLPPLYASSNHQCN